MDFIKKNAKAVVTFVLAVVLQAANDAFASGHPPLTIGDWLRYLGTSLVAAIVVWLTGNKLDLGQILAGMKKLPVPEQREVAEETLTKLPDRVSDSVVNGYPNWATG